MDQEPRIFPFAGRTRNTKNIQSGVTGLYEDKGGEWKSSGSFGRNDIPLVKWCLEQAFTAMIEEQSVQNNGAPEEVIE